MATKGFCQGLVCSVKKDKLFTRRGYDLLYVTPVSFTQLVLGDDIKVPGIDGEVEISVSPGTRSGQVFSMKGRGIKRLDGRGRGDQLIKVQLETPKNLSARQKELLKEFEAGFKNRKTVHKKGFWDKVTEVFD